MCDFRYSCKITIIEDENTSLIEKPGKGTSNCQKMETIGLLLPIGGGVSLFKTTGIIAEISCNMVCLVPALLVLMDSYTMHISEIYG